MTKLYNEANESILVIIKWQTSGWVCTMEKEECCMPALMSLSLSLKFVIFATAIFVSNIVQALTGFAGVMLSIPPSMLLFGPDMAIAVINALCWGVSVVLAWRNRRYLNLKGVLTIVGFMLSGMAIGVKLYSLVSPQIIGPVYGGIIVAAALKNLLVKPSEKPMSHWLSAVILIGAGIIHGMFASGGALLVVYLAATYHNKYTFRANVAAVWSCLNLVLMFKDFEKGMFNAQALHLMLIAIIPLLLAVYIGNKIHSRINQRMFNYSTYGLLLLSGAMILL